ncbi:MAG TPA: IS91 family transposase, partial [Xanthobacteraceae bacterium]|nr:IS91 family transposase [Xanthobacteraceae bacterium]
YGLLASGNRADNIAKLRELLAMPVRLKVSDTAETETAKPAEPGEPSVLPRPCPCCGGRMIIIETFERGATPRHWPTRPMIAIRIDTS